MYEPNRGESQAGHTPQNAVDPRGYGCPQCDSDETKHQTDWSMTKHIQGAVEFHWPEKR